MVVKVKVAGCRSETRPEPQLPVVKLSVSEIYESRDSFIFHFPIRVNEPHPVLPGLTKLPLLGTVSASGVSVLGCHFHSNSDGPDGR